MTRLPVASYRFLTSFLRRGDLPNRTTRNLTQLSDHTLREIGTAPDQIRAQTFLPQTK